jgi:hypothetical protein
MKRYVWTIWYTDEDRALFDRIDQVRRAKGMTKKGFVLYGIANNNPELAAEIVDYLMKKPRSKNRKAVGKDIEDVANTND